MHIARQFLRLSLIEQLDELNAIQWSHQLIDLKDSEKSGIALRFRVNGTKKMKRQTLLLEPMVFVVQSENYYLVNTFFLYAT